jgi:hypothetical protein
MKSEQTIRRMRDQVWKKAGELSETDQTTAALLGDITGVLDWVLDEPSWVDDE